MLNIPDYMVVDGKADKENPPESDPVKLLVQRGMANKGEFRILLPRQGRTRIPARDGGACSPDTSLSQSY